MKLKYLICNQVSLLKSWDYPGIISSFILQKLHQKCLRIFLVHLETYVRDIPDSSTLSSGYPCEYLNVCYFQLRKVLLFLRHDNIKVLQTLYSSDDYCCIKVCITTYIPPIQRFFQI